MLLTISYTTICMARAHNLHFALLLNLLFGKAVLKKEITLKGGKGQFEKLIMFYIVKNKEILVMREGVNVKISLFFFSILSDFLKGFLKEIIL